MKKNPLLIAVFFLIFLSSVAYSQDFNLLNPANELYLFSAVDEGANAFRYNPAVLGLSHRLNATINLFIQKVNNRIYLNETGLSINAGRFGLAYINNSIPAIQQAGLLTEPSYNIVNNHFNLGFGVGSKSFDFGIGLEYVTNSKYSQQDFFDQDKSRFRGTLGALFRPNKHISTALVIRTQDAFSSGMTLANSFTLGAAIRPTGKDLLTFMADFSVIPYSDQNITEYYMFKAGIDIRPYKGFELRVNYNNVHDKSNSYKYISIGAAFNFSHVSFGYTNTLSKINDYNQSDGKFVSRGTSLTASFFSEQKQTLVPEKKKVIELTLSGSLQDYNTEDVFFGILGKGKRSVHEVIADIDYAASDPSVKGLVLRIYPLATGRIDINAQLEELAGALERFKAKKKNITAYFVQDAGPAEYYIATYADNIVLPPEALLFYGLSVNVFNYRQFLEKYGVELQNFYAGKYKLTFQGILDSTTEQGKEVIERMLDVVYDKMMNRLIASRNITIDDYIKTKISQPMNGRDAMRLGLVDKLGWYEDAKKLSEDVTRTSNLVNRINRSEWDNSWSEPDEVAIIGVYGSMTAGESQAPPPVTLPIPFIGGRSTGSETVVRQLEDAFGNPKVKAVILRIDSGGGSVLGSAEINSAIIRLKKKYNKPFYVSMGGSAASGGYYVSVNADKIFADDLTITGSIGVWTTRPNVDSLLKEQKIKVENFKRGENSDIATFYRKLTPSEVEIIQGIIDYYYERFVSAISEGRKMSTEEVEQVAQGRVWLGSDAVNKRLVDEIGGLYDALEYAKKKAGIGKRYKLVYYAVPGGGTISDVITSSVVEYLQSNLLRLTGFDGNNENIEIKY